MAAYVRVTGTTQTTISVILSGMDTSYSGNTRTIEWYINDNYKYGTTLPNRASEGGAYTFTGLRPGYQYHIEAVVDASGWAEPSTFSVWEYTDEEVISVDPWDWSSSNGSASASQTQRAYDALFDHGNVSDFSYLVWNDLCDKVMEVLDAIGDSWDSSYASFSSTKMTSSNKTLTARRFNSLKTNIDNYENVAIDTVYTGDTVYGWYFTTTVNALNRWINGL